MWKNSSPMLEKTASWKTDVKKYENSIHIEEILENEGVYVGVGEGVSMWPMIRSRKDTIVVTAAKGRLKKGDVALYRRQSDGAYILHRVDEVGENSYTMLGDNCAAGEPGIREDQILGVLTGFFRGEKEVDLKGRRYKRYVKTWRKLWPVRKKFMKAGALAGRIKRKLTGGDSSLGTYRWIYGILGKKGAASIGVLTLLQSLIAANGVGFALAMRQAVNNAVAGEMRAFLGSCLLFAGLALLQVIMRAVFRSLSARTLGTFENRLRDQVLSDVLTQKYSDMQSRHTGTLMTLMTSDVTVVADGAVNLIPQVISMGVKLVAVCTALFVLVPTLTVIIIIAGVLAAALSVLIRPRLKRLHANTQEAEGRMRSYLQECLDSLIVVHAFGGEAKVKHRAAEEMEGHRRARIRKADVSNFCNSALSMGVYLGYVLAFIFCGMGIINGTSTYGTLTAVIELIGQVKAPFTSFGGSYSKYSAMLSSAERLKEMSAKEEDPEVFSADSERKIRQYIAAPKAVAFRDVYFSYDRGDVVLNSYSFSR